MGRKPQRKCAKYCQKHCFILRPVQYFAYISREVSISYCPASTKHHPLFPVFNKDRKHYTSSFCLKEDEAKYQSNDASYRKEHEKFCMQQLCEKQQMLQPKPRNKFSYCHVCKEHYDDYLEHVNSKNHKNCTKLQKFSIYIQELIESKYKQLQPKVVVDLEENQKQGSMITTMTSSFSLDEPVKQNQGFTFVSGQLERSGLKVRHLGSDTFGENIGREALSPQFQNLLRRCSNNTQTMSQKKSLSTSKFPIIVEPVE